MIWTLAAAGWTVVGLIFFVCACSRWGWPQRMGLIDILIAMLTVAAWPLILVCILIEVICGD